jgi:hypothetical protein
MITGHSQITQALADCLAHTGSVCGQLADAVSDTCVRGGPETARKARQAAGPLRQASGGLRRASVLAVRAHCTLGDAAEIIRKAPPGIPCGGCTGTGRSRLTGSTCSRCRGGGTDPYAGRP